MARSRELALIVEDEPRFRAFLAEVVHGLDMDAATAATASEARRLVRSGAPDLLLLDLNLPVVEGMTFLEEVRAALPSVPVVIITGFGDLDAAKRAIRLGVSDFLTKPCDLGQLEDAIARARTRAVEPARREMAAETKTEPTTPSLAEVEREAILQALSRSRGNRSDAARKLGISRRALYDKISEYRRLGFTVP